MLWELLACQPQGSWRQRIKKIEEFSFSLIHSFIFLTCVKSIMSQRVGAKDIVENNLTPCLHGAYSLVEDTEVT